MCLAHDLQVQIWRLRIEKRPTAVSQQPWLFGFLRPAPRKLGPEMPLFALGASSGGDARLSILREEYADVFFGDVMGI